jgi:putative hydrolase of the HAD superfamily
MDRSKTVNIKAVILDYGEVLCYMPTAENWGRMANLFKIGPVLFRQLWGRNRLLYDRGDLSYEAYWSEVADAAKVKLEPEHLKVLSVWDVEMWARINPVMVAWLKRLHSSGIRTGLLSNMPHDMIRYARKNFSWLGDFDNQTFSAEVRLTKPDSAIYRHSLDALGAAASETLFVDDRETNVEGARGVGIHAIRFQTVGQFKDELAALGFSVLPVDAESSSAVPTSGAAAQ